MPAAHKHAELFHYTSIAGLEGILRSQSLWATHAAYLNDAMEIVAFRERLPEVLEPVLANVIDSLTAGNPKNQQEIVSKGGKERVVKQAAHEVTTGLYNALLGTESTAAFMEPFVASFCTADNARTQEHGLLSQWRGYGEQGGYAIVFDREQLEKLCAEEADAWPGIDFFGGEAVYSDATAQELRDELGKDIDTIANAMRDWFVPGANPSVLEHVYPALAHCACRYKHWGFSEEKEVRLIFITPNDEVFTAQQKVASSPIFQKPRHHFFRRGTSVPCIHLFEGLTHAREKPLPISRVVVGPHRLKDERRRAVESLLAEYGLTAKVTVSQIPYVGPL